MPRSSFEGSKGTHDGLLFSIATSQPCLRRSRVQVAGELDIATSPQLNATLLQELLADRDVELDLRRVTFMDAAALGTVLGARHRFERRRRALSVCLGPGSQPHRLLTITGILPLLTVAPDGKRSTT